MFLRLFVIALAGAQLWASEPVSSKTPVVKTTPLGWIDVTGAPYFAKGNGVTDDTDALQRAISDNIIANDPESGNRGRTLYLPAGTYRVSRTLEWRDEKGLNGTMLFVQGAGREKTIIRLVDGAEGFGDPAAPRAVIKTRSAHNPPWYRHSPQGEALGEGHLAFYNGFFDLTVDTGSGNAGAIGIDYHVNNMGGMARVTVRSGDGAGVAGLELTRRNVGPGLLQDIRVEGFQFGLRFSGLYVITGEFLEFTGQKEAAVTNCGGVMALREITARGPAARIVNEDPAGLIHVLDSRLVGDGEMAGATSAIDNRGGLVLARVKQEGFANLLATPEGDTVQAQADFWASAKLAGSSEKPGAFLPIVETPAMPELDAGDWANVRDFGANPEDQQDDTAAIQKALDSGKAGVFFPNWTAPTGRYLVSAPLRVPAHVRRLEGGMCNFFVPEKGFSNATVDAPGVVFLVDQASEQPLFIERLFVRNHQSKAVTVQTVRHTAARPLVLRHFRFNTIANGAGAGRMFLEDVSGHNPIAGALQLRYSQEVWARQLNLEDAGRTKIEAGPGVRLWVLGLKTERPSAVLEAWGDAQVEIWGALNYQHHAAPAVAYQVRDKATLRAGFATATGGPSLAVGYPELLKVQRDGSEPVMVAVGPATARGSDLRLSMVPWLETPP